MVIRQKNVWMCESSVVPTVASELCVFVETFVKKDFSSGKMNVCCPYLRQTACFESSDSDPLISIQCEKSNKCGHRLYKLWLASFEQNLTSLSLFLFPCFCVRFLIWISHFMSQTVYSYNIYKHTFFVMCWIQKRPQFFKSPMSFSGIHVNYVHNELSHLPVISLKMLKY